MIVEVTQVNIELYLELMKQYQIFYKVSNIDEDKNRLFFESFLQQDGLARMSLFIQDNEAVGFSTVYFSFASSIASKVAVLNDLFVVPKARKRGIGKALINDAVSKLEHYGCSRLQWVTAQDNHTAQALYKSLGANESVWNFYSINKT